MKKRKLILPLITIFTAIFAFVPSFNALALAGPWGPERETYTWEQPATHAVFNSIINNPSLGDERNFVRIRKVGDAKFGDEAKIQVGEKYEVYIYFHNNATDKTLVDGVPLGQTAIGIADNVRLSANFPRKIQAGEKLAVNATVSARFSELVPDNVPRAVWDGAYISADETLYLSYVPGTAVVHNAGGLNGQAMESEQLFSDEGALLGYNIFSGILPGCNGYAGYVTYQIQANKAGFEIGKGVKTGDGGVVSSVAVSNGNIVEFVISYKNTSSIDQQNVRVVDVLPAGLEYQKGSTVLKNDSNPDGMTVADGITEENGINIGGYVGGTGWAEVSYKAKVVEDKCDVALKNRVVVVTEDGAQESEATVTVGGVCTPPELPVTGATEITLLIIAVMGITVGATYWYRSRKALKKAEEIAKGDKE